MLRPRTLTIAALTALSLPSLMGMGRPALPMAEGRLAYSLGQYSQAATLFAEAPATDAEAQLWKGRASFRLGRNDEAIAAWRVAAASPQTREEAKAALDEARSELAALSALLDRYALMRAAGAGGPGAAAADWRAISDDFQELADKAGQSLVGRRAALMAADALAYGGASSDAVKRFEAVKDQHPLVADWALWRMAALQPDRANELLGTLIAQYPDSPFYWEAQVALAEAQPDPARKAAALAAVVKNGEGRPAAERALYRLALMPGAGQAGSLVRYWNTFPEGRYLDEVVAALVKLPGLSADTQYRIGSYYYFRGDYGPATTYFDKVRTPIALYRKGRAHWGANELDKAVAALKTVINRDSSLAGKAFLTIGQVEAQRGHYTAAVDAYNKAAKYGGEAGVTARWKLSRIYREQKKAAQALALEKGIVSDYPWSEEATTINWNGFWNALTTRHWQDALVNGKRLAAHNPDHAYGVAAQYWIGRIYERMGDSAKASAAYKGLVGRSPSSYYGWRASFRQLELSGKGRDPWFATQPGRTVQDQPIRWADLLGKSERDLLAGARGTALPREMLAWPESVRELMFLRQFEVAGLYTHVGKSPNLEAWLSHLQMHYRDAIRQEKGEPRLSYPLGFAPSLMASAGRNHIDSLLLAALVREESRYDPAIKSWVGATGLTQLMPSTADWVAKQVPEVSGRPLTDPHANLMIGGWYLAYTHRVFDGGSLYAVAAYNGGPGAVSKWKRQFTFNEPDEFVEAIPYAETRLYVKKVFSSYWNYVKLYG